MERSDSCRPVLLVGLLLGLLLFNGCGYVEKSFIINGYGGSPAAIFQPNGDLFLGGRVHQEYSGSAPVMDFNLEAPFFIVAKSDPDADFLMILDCKGNLVLRGTLKDLNSGRPNDPDGGVEDNDQIPRDPIINGSSFIVKAQDGRELAYLDHAGNLFIRGEITTAGQFQRIRIGDRDGFGGGPREKPSTSLLFSGTRSANRMRPYGIPENEHGIPTPAQIKYYPVKTHEFGSLRSGDFLPDFDGDDTVSGSVYEYPVSPGGEWDPTKPLSPTGNYAGDNWDNRTEADTSNTFCSGANYTDMSLSISYADIYTKAHNWTGPNNPYGNNMETAGPFPYRPDQSTSRTDVTPTFIFDMVDPDDATKRIPIHLDAPMVNAWANGDTTKNLYLNFIVADYDAMETVVAVTLPGATTRLFPIVRQSSGFDGFIQPFSIQLTNVVSNGSTASPWLWTDLLKSDGTGGYNLDMKVEFVEPSGTTGTLVRSPEPYLAFDFIELSVDQRSVGITVIDESLTNPNCDESPVAVARLRNALASARSGDTILASGCFPLDTYPDVSTGDHGLVFPKKSVVLQKLEGADTLKLYFTTPSESNGPVVIFPKDQPIGTILRGAEISGGNATAGGGVYCEADGPWQPTGNVMIRECDIHGNKATRGGGVYRAAFLYRNLIRENEAELEGGGLYGGDYLALNVVRDNFLSTPSTTNGAGLHLPAYTVGGTPYYNRYRTRNYNNSYLDNDNGIPVGPMVPDAMRCKGSGDAGSIRCEGCNRWHAKRAGEEDAFIAVNCILKSTTYCQPYWDGVFAEGAGSWLSHCRLPLYEQPYSGSINAANIDVPRYIWPGDYMQNGCGPLACSLLGVGDFGLWVNMSAPYETNPPQGWYNASEFGVDWERISLGEDYDGFRRPEGPAVLPMDIGAYDHTSYLVVAPIYCP